MIIIDFIVLIFYIAFAVLSAVMAHLSYAKIDKILSFIFFGWFCFASIVYMVDLVQALL